MKSRFLKKLFIAGLILAGLVAGFFATRELMFPSGMEVIALDSAKHDLPGAVLRLCALPIPPEGFEVSFAAIVGRRDWSMLVSASCSRDFADRLDSFLKNAGTQRERRPLIMSVYKDMEAWLPEEPRELAFRLRDRQVEIVMQPRGDGYQILILSLDKLDAEVWKMRRR